MQAAVIELQKTLNNYCMCQS